MGQITRHNILYCIVYDLNARYLREALTKTSNPTMSREFKKKRHNNNGKRRTTQELLSLFKSEALVP